MWKSRVIERSAGFVTTPKTQPCLIAIWSMSAIASCSFKFEIGFLFQMKICWISSQSLTFHFVNLIKFESTKHLVSALSMAGLIRSPLAALLGFMVFLLESERAPLSLEGPLVVGWCVSQSSFFRQSGLSLHLWGWVMKWVMPEVEAQAEAISSPTSNHRMRQRFLLWLRPKRIILNSTAF